MSRGDRLEETYYSFSYSPIVRRIRQNRRPLLSQCRAHCEHAQRPSPPHTLRAVRERAPRKIHRRSLRHLSRHTRQQSRRHSVLAPLPDGIRRDIFHRRRSKAPSTSPKTSMASVLARVSLDGKTPSTIWPLDKVIAFSKAEIIQFPPHGALPIGAANRPLRKPSFFPSHLRLKPLHSVS